MKKMLSILSSVALVFTMVPAAALASPDVPLAAQANGTIEMHRLYNPNSGEHFYTGDEGESQSLSEVGWNYEGIEWTAPDFSSTPVHRLYSGTDHHYCISDEECDALIDAGWFYEGVGWYSDDAKGVPLWRQFNPNVDPSAPTNNSGSHNYTTSEDEHNFLCSIGWVGEDVGWYGVDPNADASFEEPGYPDYPSEDYPTSPDYPAQPDNPTNPDYPSYPDYPSANPSNPGPSTPEPSTPGPSTPTPSTPTKTMCKVTFNGNGGSVSYTTKSVEKGKQLGSLPSASLDDHYDVGWYTSPTGGTPYYSNTIVNSDLTLYAHWELTESAKRERAVANVKKYSYSIKPVNGSFNNIFFVETDNPDPNSFQLVDTSSKYLEGGKTSLIKPVPWTYGDIVYSNAETKRIANKGYLFYNYECDTDGGTLDIKATLGTSYQAANYETGIKVSCPALEDRVDYLLRTYASGKTDFFDKLDAVQSGLGQIALYPKGVRDTNAPSASSYPCLAASPYPELGLNKHIEGMYEEGEPLFIDSAYGFILDSSSFPGMIYSVAKRLQPDCEDEHGFAHWIIDITYNGKTKSYGGAGTGSTYPLYTQFVEKTFRFDGTDQGYGTNLSMSVLRAKRLDYAAKSDAFAEAALATLSPKAVASVVGDGAWIQIAYEGLLGGGTTIGYAAYSYDGSIDYAFNAWVDGRYVNDWERYEPDAKFADHPTARIILNNVTYTDRYGETHTTSVTYGYHAGLDIWEASSYYLKGNYSYEGLIDELPASLKLTRAQVDKMVASGQIDGKTSVVPTAKYIYDGSAAPGTPCN